MNQKKPTRRHQALESRTITPEAVYRLIGLAIRANQAKTGTEGTLNAIGHDQVRLVIVADDAAENTRHQIELAAIRNQVPLVGFGCKSELGHWTGHAERAIVAVLDQGFADRLQDLISKMNSNRGHDVQEGYLEEKE